MMYSLGPFNVKYSWELLLFCLPPLSYDDLFEEQKINDKMKVFIIDISESVAEKLKAVIDRGFHASYRTIEMQKYQ